MTTDQWINIVVAFFGGIGAIAAAVSAGRSLYVTQITARENKRRFNSGIISQVFPEGTFLLRNETGESVTIEIKQHRFAHDTQTNNDAETVKDIYNKLNSGKTADLINKIKQDGILKVTNISLAPQEELQIPDSAMYGYSLAEIKHIVIGTFISYVGEKSKESVHKFYLHRFTMGGNPQPNGRWVQLTSKLMTDN